MKYEEVETLNFGKNFCMLKAKWTFQDFCPDCVDEFLALSLKYDFNGQKRAS